MEGGHNQGCPPPGRGGGGGPPCVLPADLPQQLGHDFDLLATGEQVAEGHARDARHLHEVHQHHESLQQPQRQVRVLQAVHRQAAARLLIAVLGTGHSAVSGGQGRHQVQAGGTRSSARARADEMGQVS